VDVSCVHVYYPDRGIGASRWNFHDESTINQRKIRFNQDKNSIIIFWCTLRILLTTTIFSIITSLTFLVQINAINCTSNPNINTRLHTICMIMSHSRYWTGNVVIRYGRSLSPAISRADEELLFSTRHSVDGEQTAGVSLSLQIDRDSPSVILISVCSNTSSGFPASSAMSSPP
jgi:hypothetical protein